MANSKGHGPQQLLRKALATPKSQQVMRMLHPEHAGVQRMAEQIDRACTNCEEEINRRETVEPEVQQKLEPDAPSPALPGPQIDRACVDCEEEVDRKEVAEPEVQAKSETAAPPEMPEVPPPPPTPPEVQRTACENCEDEVQREEEEGSEEAIFAQLDEISAAGEDISRACVACENEVDAKGAGVSSPGDPAEVEADAVANRLVGIVEFNSEGDSEEGHAMVRGIGQGRTGGGGAGNVSDAFMQRLHQRKGGGQMIPADLLDRLEGLMGMRFEDVRLHLDNQASLMAQEISARAFAWGRDIYFAAGEFQPGTEAGFELLLHELVHIVQRGGGLMRMEKKTKKRSIPTAEEWASGTIEYYLYERRDQSHSLLILPYNPEMDAQTALVKTMSKALLVSEDEASQIIASERLIWNAEYDPEVSQVLKDGAKVKIIHIPNKFIERVDLEDEAYGHNMVFEAPFEDLFQTFSKFVEFYNKVEAIFEYSREDRKTAMSIYNDLDPAVRPRVVELAGKTYETALKVARGDVDERLYYIFDLWAHAIGVDVKPYSPVGFWADAVDIYLACITFGTSKLVEWVSDAVFPPAEDLESMRPNFVDRIKWVMVRENRAHHSANEKSEVESLFLDLQQLADRVTISIFQNLPEFLTKKHVAKWLELREMLFPVEMVIHSGVEGDVLPNGFEKKFDKLAQNIWEEGKYEIGDKYLNGFVDWREHRVDEVKALGKLGKNRTAADNKEYLMLFYRATFAMAWIMGERTRKRRANLAWEGSLPVEGLFQEDYHKKARLNMEDTGSYMVPDVGRSEFISENRRVEGISEGIMESSKLGRDLLGFEKQHPEAEMVNAFFYPQEMIDQFRRFRMEDGPENGGQPIRLYLYFEPPTLDPNEPIASKKGTWHLVDFTHRNERAENTAEGYRNHVPVVELFKQLDHKMRFPEGALYFRMPDESSYRILKTNGDMEWYDWLKWIGMAITVAAAIVTTGGTVLAIAGSVILAVATVGEMIDREKHGMADAATRFIDVMDIVGSLAAAGGGAAKLALVGAAELKLGMAGIRAIQNFERVLKVAEIGSDAFNLVLMAKDAHDAFVKMSQDGTDPWTMTRTMAFYIGIGAIQVVGLKDGFGDIGDINAARKVELGFDDAADVFRISTRGGRPDLDLPRLNGSNRLDPDFGGQVNHGLGDLGGSGRGDLGGSGRGDIGGSPHNHGLPENVGGGRQGGLGPNGRTKPKGGGGIGTKPAAEIDPKGADFDLIMAQGEKYTATITESVLPSGYKSGQTKNITQTQEYRQWTEPLVIPRREGIPEHTPFRNPTPQEFQVPGQQDFTVPNQRDFTNPKELGFEPPREQDFNYDPFKDAETDLQPYTKPDKPKENADTEGDRDPLPTIYVRKWPRGKDKDKEPEHPCKNEPNRMRFVRICLRLRYNPSRQESIEMRDFWCDANHLILDAYPGITAPISKTSTIKAYLKFKNKWPDLYKRAYSALKRTINTKSRNPRHLSNAKEHLKRYFQRYREFGIYGYASLIGEQRDMAVAKQNVLKDNFNVEYHRVEGNNLSTLPLGFQTFYKTALKHKKAIFRRSLDKELSKMGKNSFLELKAFPNIFWKVDQSQLPDDGKPRLPLHVKRRYFKKTNGETKRREDPHVVEKLEEISGLFVKNWERNFAYLQLYPDNPPKGGKLPGYTTPLVAVSGGKSLPPYTVDGKRYSTVTNTTLKRRAFAIHHTNHLHYDVDRTGSTNHREHDSEVKIFGKMWDDKKKGAYKNVGKMDVVLYTDRITCESCTDLVFLIKQKFRYAKSEENQIRKIHIIYTDLSYY